MSNDKKIWKAARLPAGLAAALVAAGLAHAVPTPAALNAIQARKANFKEIGGAFKSINDELKSGSPDLNSVRPLARDLASRAGLAPRYFPAGSGPDSGAPTRAKAEIWTRQAEFQKAAADMAAAANRLNAAAASGDLAGMTASRNALGAACKSCHDEFRKQE